MTQSNCSETKRRSDLEHHHSEQALCLNKQSGLTVRCLRKPEAPRVPALPLSSPGYLQTLLTPARAVSTASGSDARTRGSLAEKKNFNRSGLQFRRAIERACAMGPRVAPNLP